MKLGDNLTRRMLCLLDGEHTQEQLCQELEKEAAKPITIQQVQENLEKVVRLAVLVG